MLVDLGLAIFVALVARRARDAGAQGRPWIVATALVAGSPLVTIVAGIPHLGERYFLGSAITFVLSLCFAGAAAAIMHAMHQTARR